jgi:hypothetical protein
MKSEMTMEADPKSPLTSKAGDEPKAPVQLYPPPGSSDPSVTSTQVRQLREDVLDELEEDNQFVLPLRTRLALLALLTASLCIVMVLVPHRGQTPAQPAAKQVVIAPAPPVAPISKTPAPTVQPVNPEPKKAEAPLPAKPFSKDLADVEVLATLVRDDITFESDRALKLLTPYIKNADPEVKAAAQKALAPVFARIDERARTTARAAAEAAEDHLRNQDYPGALETLKTGLDALPPDAPFTERAKKSLLALIDKTTREREDARLAAFANLETQIRAGDLDAQQRLATLLSHPDPTFRQPAEAVKAKISEEAAKRLADKQQRDESARKAWGEFFQKFDAAMLKGDLNAAQALCTRPAGDPNGPLFSGGVSDPRAVLDGLSGDVKSIQALYDTALAHAKESKSDVILMLRKGVRLEGVLDGVEGRQVKLLYHGAQIGANIEEFSAIALTTLIGFDQIAKQNLKPALWALSAYDSPQNGAAEILKQYSAAKLEVPLHWSERIKLERMKKLTEELDKKLAELNEALAAGESNPDGVKAALDGAQPVIAEYEKSEPLNEASRKVVLNAQKLVGSRVHQQIVLQNGVLPTTECAVLSSDQISEYREDQKKVNLPKIYGLKLGSGGGIQRVLFRLDGIESALGRTHLKKATLQFYQIESPSSNGAVVGLFALKRAWNPGAGTWVCYDGVKKLDWTAPGASADADVVTKDEVRVTLDNKHDCWRSFDVTQYVKNVLTGKQQNLGFLLRVVSNEPSFQVWFYPETDLDLKRDKSLRPKLVLDVEKEKE